MSQNVVCSAIILFSNRITQLHLKLICTKFNVVKYIPILKDFNLRKEHLRYRSVHFLMQVSSKAESDLLP